VQRKVADARAGDDELDARVGNLFEDLFEREGDGFEGGRSAELLPQSITARQRTFSICFSSPFVKSIISPAFLRRTVPLVSVCEMSSPHVKTATFILEPFLTTPSGSRPKTMPRTTREWLSAPPRILTTRTESTLKSATLRGMTASDASATRVERNVSDPGCFDAIEGAIDLASVAWAGGSGSDRTESSEREIRAGRKPSRVSEWPRQRATSPGCCPVPVRDRPT
jgi:hypothetical protein